MVCQSQKQLYELVCFQLYVLAVSGQKSIHADLSDAII